MARPEDVIAVYQEAMDDLREVIKPHIQFLTMMAQDHVQYASQIVSIIEGHIQKVKPKEKLPAIYLIDSIVNDLPQSPYKSLFTKNIVHTFTSVFEKVDMKTRLTLYSVRLSWARVFPNDELYSLDWQINTCLDPAWPIIAKSPVQDSSYVNPRCHQSRQQFTRPVKRRLEEDYTRYKRPKLEAYNSGSSNLVHNMSDLAGRLHQDHKNGHTHPSSTFVDQKASLQIQSSNKKGSHNFKKSHSEDYGMPQTTNTTGLDADTFNLFSRLKIEDIIPSTSSQDPARTEAKMKVEPSLEVLPVSRSSQMITFTFENGCTATIRTSGTEPKIKYYTEHRPDPKRGMDQAEVQKELDKIVECIKTYFFRPDKYGLIARTDN